MSDLRRFGWALLALAAVLGAGTVGFHLLNDYGWMTALYRSFLTVSLTGVDTRPDGTAAELFTMALVLAGVAIFLYVAGAVVELIASGVLTGTWAERRRRRTIERLRDHYIICGYGRVARRTVAEMIVAIRKRDGTFDTTPLPDAVFDVGDVMIAAGSPEELRKLEDIFAPREAVAP